MELSRDDVVDKVPPRFEGHADRAAYLAAEYKYGVYLMIVSVVVLVASGRMGLPEIPEWWTVVLEGIALGAIPAAILSKIAIVDPWIPDPRYDVLVLKDDETYSPFVKKTPQNLWERRHKGEFSAWEPPAGPIDYVVTNYEFLEDVDELVVEGVNPEIANPLSVLARDQMLEEIYEDLQYKAAELDRYKSRERTRRLEYDRQHVNSLMAAVEHCLEFDAGTMEAIQEDDEEEIEGAVDADDRPRSDEPDDRPTLEDMLTGFASNEPGVSSGPQQTAATDGGVNK